MAESGLNPLCHFYLKINKRGEQNDTKCSNKLPI